MPPLIRMLSCSIYLQNKPMPPLEQDPSSRGSRENALGLSVYVETVNTPESFAQAKEGVPQEDT